MKKLILILSLFMALGLTAQVTNSPVKRVATDKTAYGQNLPTGTIIINIATGEVWELTGAASSVYDLSTSTKVLINHWETVDDTTQLRSARNLSMGTTRIVNLGTPSLDYDAATKKYVDDATGTTGNGLWEVAGAIGTRLKTPTIVDIQQYAIEDVSEIRMVADADRWIKIKQTTTGASPDLYINGADAYTTTLAGGDVHVSGGTGGSTSGSPIGGDVYIYGANGDSEGDVVLAYDGLNELGKVGINRMPSAAMLDVNGSFGLKNSASVIVDSLELVLTASQTNIPTSYAVWNALGSSVSTRDEFSATTSQTNFSLTFTLTSASTVYVNGALLRTTDYSGTASTTLVLTTASYQYDAVLVISN